MKIYTYYIRAPSRKKRAFPPVGFGIYTFTNAPREQTKLHGEKTFCPRTKNIFTTDKNIFTTDKNIFPHGQIGNEWNTFTSEPTTREYIHERTDNPGIHPRANRQPSRDVPPVRPQIL
jgi:hypothetical protein